MAALLDIDRLALDLAGATDAAPLVEDFSLRLEPGEVVGLVGETGAGKSLSMRAAAGLLPAAIRSVAGTVGFRGTSVEAADTKGLRARLGHGICLLLQNGRGALNPFLRVQDQVSRILGYQGVPRRERASRAATLLEAVGLPSAEFGARYPHQLSGGQAQRVAMVIALATNPALLIADEPTTALDVTTERDVIGLLGRLCAERALGLILITHNLGLVARICRRVVIMHAGHIVEAGPTAEIFAAPRHPYTRALMAAVPDLETGRLPSPLEGTVPLRSEFGRGCRFLARCPLAQPRCRAAVPALEGEGRQVRCFFPLTAAARPGAALAAV